MSVLGIISSPYDSRREQGPRPLKWKVRPHRETDSKIVTWCAYWAAGIFCSSIEKCEEPSLGKKNEHREHRDFFSSGSRLEGNSAFPVATAERVEGISIERREEGIVYWIHVCMLRLKLNIKDCNSAYNSVRCRSQRGTLLQGCNEHK
jgi:hypothetical protein